MSENDTVDTSTTNDGGENGESGSGTQRDPKVDSGFAKLRREKEEAEERAAKLARELEEAKRSPNAPVTREDLYKINERQALETLAASDAEKDKEIVENKDAILSYYTPRRGRDTKESIMADLRTAHEAWRYENPKQDTSSKDAVRTLQEGGQKSTGAPKGVVDTQVKTDRFTKPSGPQGWYPSKKEE